MGNSYTVHLVRGKHPTINDVTLSDDLYLSASLTIARAGLFVVISSHEHGLEVMWDRGKITPYYGIHVMCTYQTSHTSSVFTRYKSLHHAG